jgi:hypothetical protein
MELHDKNEKGNWRANLIGSSILIAGLGCLIIGICEAVKNEPRKDGEMVSDLLRKIINT